MYAGLAGTADAEHALEKARALPAAHIDRRNSRSCLLAHLMTTAADY